jgi:hypothetical protein
VDSNKLDVTKLGCGGVDWIDLALDKEKWKRSCECGNEPSGALKCWETTEWLHNWWPLEFSYLVS